MLSPRPLIFITTICFALTAFAARDTRFATWAKIQTPTSRDAKVYGTYSAGCIDGAIKLPADPNIRVIRPKTGVHFGHPQTIRYVRNLASKIASLGLPPIGVEDIAGPRGGPVVANHMSHQTGLDIDISFELLDLKETELETHQSEAFVDSNDIRSLKKTWTAQQDSLIENAANSVDVDKIFVAPAIKKHFCEKFPDAPWLFKLRAYDGHDDHMHVRLKPPGHGSNSLGTGPKQCGSDLDETFIGWAGSELDAFLPPYQPSRFPDLPKACDGVLAAPGHDS